MFVCVCMYEATSQLVEIVKGDLVPIAEQCTQVCTRQCGYQISFDL